VYFNAASIHELGREKSREIFNIHPETLMH